jgi:hypothetical protein
MIMRRPLQTALAALACVCLLWPSISAGQAVAPAAAGAPPPSALPVPGGVAALARAIGLEETTPRARVMLAAIRVLYERPVGADAAADARRDKALAYVAQSARQPAGLSDNVPLPLPADVWMAWPGTKAEPGAPVLGIILGDRRAALAYYGLCAMDPEMRAYLSAHADARALLFDARTAPVVALYGRSLRIIGGRVDVPGGSGAQAWWEALVGAPVADPVGFFRAVLTRDGGRLALFYDTLAHLDAPRLALAFGGTAPGAARLKALYDASAAALAGWDPVARPFIRVAYDAAQLLAALPLAPDGQLAGPTARGLWAAAFGRDGVPDDPVAELKGIRPDDRLDLAGLVSLLGAANTRVRRERTEAWLIAQRVFAAAAEPEWPDVLVAVRAYPQFPSIIVTLDRVGVTRPSVYAAAVRRAVRVTRGFDRQKTTAAVALFQGALALVERARFSRSLDATQADALVASLCAVPVNDEGEYLGGVAAWIEQAFLPAVGAAQTSEAARAALPLEDRALAAMAGFTAARAGVAGAAPTVAWEGLAYRVEPASAEFARLVAIRGRQAGAPLDPGLAFARIAARVRAAVSAADVVACLSALESAAAMVAAVPASVGPAAAELPGDRLLDRARAGLKELTDPPNPNPLGRIAKLLRQASDAYTAQALVSIAYAPHLGDGETTALLGGDPAWRHTFGLEDTRGGLALTNPWRPAEETRARTQGWFVAGSILNLDLALGRLSLRRVGSDRLPDPPSLRDVDRQAFVDAFVLTAPADLADPARDAIVDAIARGRARLSEAAGSPGHWHAMAAAAGLDEWRSEAASWAAVFDPRTASGFFSLAELARLGTGPANTMPPETWHAFGVSGWPLEARPALRFLTALPWAGMAGRNGTRLVPALVPDLTLAMAEALASRRLPAALLRGVLAFATQDLLDQLRANHDDDWMTMIARAQAVAQDRFDDYVAALTSGGPLRPER